METSIDLAHREKIAAAITTFKRDAFYFSTRGKMSCFISSFILGFILCALAVTVVHYWSKNNFVTYPELLVGVGMVIGVAFTNLSYFRFNIFPGEPNESELAAYFLHKMQVLKSMQEVTEQQLTASSDAIETLITVRQRLQIPIGLITK